MTSLPEDVIEQNRTEITGLLELVDPPGIEEFIVYLYGPSCDYFTAPASTSHHLNVRGGLAQHSLNVYRTLLDLNEKYMVIKDPKSIIIIGLLHDFCKVNLYTEKFNKNGSRSKKPYVQIDQLPIGHGEKSVILLQSWLDLTSEEIACIRWHMGMFDYAFKQFSDKAQKEYPGVWLTYMADHLATLYVDPLPETT